MSPGVEYGKRNRESTVSALAIYFYGMCVDAV